MPFKYFVGCFRKYATFGGRATRSELWWYLLFWFALSLVVGNYARITGHFIAYDVFLLATLLPTASVGARRLHDTGRTGHLMWCVFIPFAGIIMLIALWAMPSAAGPNAYGAPVEAVPSPAMPPA
jgi:uncharacterized membrane protein YhaH (DUF805 family)